MKASLGSSELVINLDETTLAEAAALLKWIDGVRLVDPASFPIAAEKWQIALRELLDGSEDMLRALEGISPRAIENFDLKKSFTVDDAIEFERHGFGSILPVRRTVLAVPQKHQLKVFVRTILVALVVPLLVAFISIALSSWIGISDYYIPFVGIFCAILGIFFIFSRLSDQKSLLTRLIFPAMSFFWVSPKGIYFFSKVFKNNPSNSVLWEIFPVEEEKIALHIDNNPGINREFPGH